MSKTLLLALAALGATLVGCGSSDDARTAADAVQSRNGQAASMGGHAGAPGPGAPAGGPGGTKPSSTP